MQQNRFEIVCTEELMSKIEDHCFSSTKTEVGGFLVGKIEDGKSIVTHVLKAKHTANTQSQLTFTNKTWEAALAEMGEIGSDAALIGWFHSHPNFGVFLSDYDKFIQNEFFKLDGMITIVVDPINGKRGWFISLDKEVRPYAPEEDTKREKLKKKEDEDKPDAGIQVKERASTQGVSLSKVVAIAAAFSMLSFVGGFATSGTRGASLDQIGVLEAQVTQLKFQVENLLLGGSEEEAVTEPEVVVTSGAKPSSTSGTKKVPQSTNKKTPNTPAKSTVGSSCPKAGDLTNGGKLICKKVGEKLVWAVRVIPANDKKGKESGNTGTSQGTSSGGSNNSGTSSSDGSTSSGGSKPTNDSDNPSDTNQDTKSTDENQDK